MLILAKQLSGLKKSDFVILKKHTSGPIRKGRLNPTSKARREANRNQFMEKSGAPDRVESFREVDRSKNHPRARIDLLNPGMSNIRPARQFYSACWPNEVHEVIFCGPCKGFVPLCECLASELGLQKI